MSTTMTPETCLEFAQSKRWKQCHFTLVSCCCFIAPLDELSLAPYNILFELLFCLQLNKELWVAAPILLIYLWDLRTASCKYPRTYYWNIIRPWRSYNIPFVKHPNLLTQTFNHVTPGILNKPSAFNAKM